MKSLSKRFSRKSKPSNQSSQTLKTIEEVISDWNKPDNQTRVEDLVQLVRGNSDELLANADFLEFVKLRITTGNAQDLIDMDKAGLFNLLKDKNNVGLVRQSFADALVRSLIVEESPYDYPGDVQMAKQLVAIASKIVDRKNNPIPEIQAVEAMLTSVLGKAHRDLDSLVSTWENPDFKDRASKLKRFLGVLGVDAYNSENHKKFRQLVRDSFAKMNLKNIEDIADAGLFTMLAASGGNEELNTRFQSKITGLIKSINDKITSGTSIDKITDTDLKDLALKEIKDARTLVAIGRIMYSDTEQLGSGFYHGEMDMLLSLANQMVGDLRLKSFKNALDNPQGVDEACVRDSLNPREDDTTESYSQLFVEMFNLSKDEAVRLILLKKFAEHKDLHTDHIKKDVVDLCINAVGNGDVDKVKFFIDNGFVDINYSGEEILKNLRSCYEKVNSINEKDEEDRKLLTNYQKIAEELLKAVFVRENDNFGKAFAIIHQGAYGSILPMLMNEQEAVSHVNMLLELDLQDQKPSALRLQSALQLSPRAKSSENSTPPTIN
jgi:hypothetical protein